MWKDTRGETFIFVLLNPDQVRNNLKFVDSLLHTSKLIWGLEMTIYTVWWKQSSHTSHQFWLPIVQMRAYESLNTPYPCPQKQKKPTG